jgi:hypothetical protein
MVVRITVLAIEPSTAKMGLRKDALLAVLVGKSDPGGELLAGTWPGD